MKNEGLNKAVSIGEKIKTRRKILGFSQEELAYRMFTSKQMISVDLCQYSRHIFLVF